MKTKLLSLIAALSLVTPSFAAIAVTANAADTVIYKQVGEDFKSETETDNVASLWSVTVTPGDDAITSISVKVKDSKGQLHGTDEVYDTPVCSGGDVAFGVVVNHPAADIAGITAVVNNKDVEAVADTQSLGLSGVNNARELGGYAAADGKKVKKGTLLRTAALGKATNEDIRKLCDEYHLATVIDLRMSREVTANPDPEIEGVKNVNLGIMDEKTMAEKMSALTPADMEGIDMNDPVGRLKLAIKAGIVGDQMYIDFLSSDQGKEGYKKMFEELLAVPDGGSLLFHCTQGKDRTGCAAMLILSALGVDEETIINDFMLTNTYNAKLISSQRKELIDAGYSGDELQTLMSAKDEVNEQYMRNALVWIKENYGSVEGYITDALGITDDQINTLKAKYLE